MRFPHRAIEALGSPGGSSGCFQKRMLAGGQREPNPAADTPLAEMARPARGVTPADPNFPRAPWPGEPWAGTNDRSRHWPTAPAHTGLPWIVSGSVRRALSRQPGTRNPPSPARTQPKAGRTEGRRLGQEAHRGLWTRGHSRSASIRSSVRVLRGAPALVGGTERSEDRGALPSPGPHLWRPRFGKSLAAHSSGRGVQGGTAVNKEPAPPPEWAVQPGSARRPPSPSPRLAGNSGQGQRWATCARCPRLAPQTPRWPGARSLPAGPRAAARPGGASRAIRPQQHPPCGGSNHTAEPLRTMWGAGQKSPHPEASHRGAAHQRRV